MIVVLIGYMASGKSTIGRQLSSKLNYQFIDLDNFIEEKVGMSISKLFKSKGEIYFRKLEASCLVEILNKEDNLVLSLGGGTPCYGDNMDVLLNANNTVSIYLKTSIKTVVKRLINENSKRPLVAHLNSEDEIAEFVGKHLFERSTFYNRANHTISTDNKVVDEIIEEVIFDLF